MLYVPDIEPGLALKFLSRFANRIALTMEESRSYFPNHQSIAVTGYPTRKGLSKWNRLEAQQALNLRPDLPTLLVFGGSRGARSINRALFPALTELLPEMQILHIRGRANWHEVEAHQSELDPQLLENYHPYPYLHAKMGAALRAADLALCRAGASSLGEFPLFGLPAILVPYPHAWRYQKVNAEYLTRRGGAVILRDEELPDKITSSVLALMFDPGRRAEMSAAMEELAKPEAAESIAKELTDLAGK